MVLIKRTSLCLIAKNEETNLPACLSSVADLVSETIVIDTGSIDRTKEIAAQFGARVYDFPWVDDFSAARNECLRHATGDWIFWLDADDRLDEPNRDRLRTLFAGLKDENAAYVMQCLSLADTASGPAMETGHVRLFRNHAQIRWQYRVHEQILSAIKRAGGEVRWSDVVIHHTGYQDPALRRKKLERDLRLVQLDHKDHPDDPFILFNLGSILMELGDRDGPAKVVEAIPLLRKSLELSHPTDSIVRKLYALLTNAHRRLGDPNPALASCRTGRARFPDDPELLFLEAIILREHGDLNSAERLLAQLTQSKPGAYFASVDQGIRSFKARHHLALVYRQQGRPADAETEWRAVLEEQPAFEPARIGLAELYLEQARWTDLEGAVKHLETSPNGMIDAAILRGRALLAQKNYAAARRTLEEAIARVPQAVAPRVILTHVLLQEGQDHAAAERALRELLLLDPSQAESWRNLAVLQRHQGHPAEARLTCRAGLEHNPGDIELALLEGVLARELGDLSAAEATLIRVLELTAAAFDPHSQERGRQARHELALTYHRQNRLAEAESQWKAILAERPDYLMASLGLAEVYLAQQRFPDLEGIAKHLDSLHAGSVEAAVLRARGHMARQDFAEARTLLQQTIARAPQALWPRVILSHALLQESRDLPAAEQALRNVLGLDPSNAEASRNLAILLQQQSANGGPPAPAGPINQTKTSGDEP